MLWDFDMFQVLVIKLGGSVVVVLIVALHIVRLVKELIDEASKPRLYGSCLGAPPRETQPVTDQRRVDDHPTPESTTPRPRLAQEGSLYCEGKDAKAALGISRDGGERLSGRLEEPSSTGAS
jgi:hypothetical protein